MLKLRSVYLSVEHVKLIMESENVAHLKVLDLSENDIGSVGAEHVGSASMKELTSLNLASCHIVDRVNALSHLFSQLTSLNLRGNSVGCEVAKVLSSCDMSRLTFLNISDTDLTYENITSIANTNFPNLTTLIMSRFGTESTSKNYVNIQELKALTQKRSEWIQLLSAMLCFKKATTLQLNGNALGEDGVAYVLKHAMNVTHLDLRDNELNADALKAIASSSNMEKLKTLNIKEYATKNYGLSFLANSVYLSNLETLSLEMRCSEKEYVTLFTSPYMSHLTDLNISQSVRLTEKGIKALGSSSSMRNLTKLQMEACLFGREAVECFATHCESLSNLRTLGMNSCYLGEEEATIIKNSPFLGKLTSFGYFTYIDRD